VLDLLFRSNHVRLRSQSSNRSRGAGL
jgi:hypothetical protein